MGNQRQHGTAASAKIAVSASLLPMNALPAAAATTPASKTVDHSPKIASD